MIDDKETASLLGAGAAYVGLPDITEDIRLVVWDLDETFWRGTLTEGGIDYRPEHEAIVIELARRGIVSSICSKNDRARVEEILAQRPVREHFVFPQIDWAAKGPKLKTLIETIGLRPASVLFIDDNPMMRREASHFVPGLNVASEDAIPLLLGHPRLRGKPDSACERLAHYKLLERRHADHATAETDIDDFLRASGITVTIDYDVETHLDRAIELINRTNQLNFTKRRLPEDRDAAAAQLLATIRTYDVQSGLVRVRDRYGDYGYVGLYVVRRSIHPGSGLIHFVFSCRTLGMRVETWLYRRLGRPPISIVGDVVSDIHDETIAIDWIEAVESFGIDTFEDDAVLASEIHFRGGCELIATSHYCRPLAEALYGEFADHRDGIQIRIEHSAMGRHATPPPPPPREVLESFRKLGFMAEDFDSRMLGRSADDAIWILSFWADPVYPLYRHKASGAVIPFNAFPAAHPFQDLSRLALDCVAPEFRDHWIMTALAHLAEAYELVGLTDEAMFKDNLRAMFDRLPARGRAIVIGSNEWSPPDPAGSKHPRQAHVDVNRFTRDVVAEYPQVRFLAASDYLRGDEDVDAIHADHYPRTVYHRIFEMIRMNLADMPRGVDRAATAKSR